MKKIFYSILFLFCTFFVGLNGAASDDSEMIAELKKYIDTINDESTFKKKSGFSPANLQKVINEKCISTGGTFHTPFEYAVNQKKDQALINLINESNYVFNKNQAEVVLKYAVEQNKKNVFSQLLLFCDEEMKVYLFNEKLFESFYSKKRTVVEECIKNKDDLLAILIIAYLSYFDESNLKLMLKHFIDKNDSSNVFKVMTLLKDKEVNLSDKFIDGNSPLQYALTKNGEDVIKQLGKFFEQFDKNDLVALLKYQITIDSVGIDLLQKLGSDVATEGSLLGFNGQKPCRFAISQQKAEACSQLFFWADKLSLDEMRSAFKLGIDSNKKLVVDTMIKYVIEKNRDKELFDKKILEGSQHYSHIAYAQLKKKQEALKDFKKNENELKAFISDEDKVILEGIEGESSGFFEGLGFSAPSNYPLPDLRKARDTGPMRGGKEKEKGDGKRALPTQRESVNKTTESSDSSLMVKDSRGDEKKLKKSLSRRQLKGISVPVGDGRELSRMSSSKNFASSGSNVVLETKPELKKQTSFLEDPLKSIQNRLSSLISSSSVIPSLTEELESESKKEKEVVSSAKSETIVVAPTLAGATTSPVASAPAAKFPEQQLIDERKSSVDSASTTAAAKAKFGGGSSERKRREGRRHSVSRISAPAPETLAKPEITVVTLFGGQTVIGGKSRQEQSALVSEAFEVLSKAFEFKQALNKGNFDNAVKEMTTQVNLRISSAESEE